MKILSRALLAILLTAAPVLAATATVPLPTVEGEEAIATVNGEPITLEDLLALLGTMHTGVEVPDAPVRRADPSKLLERLINVRLVLQEAQNIGLDELPEMERQLEAARLDLIREAVIEERLRDVTEGDPNVVERLYRDAVREVRVESALFSSEEQVEAFLAKLEAGSGFEATARAAVAGGQALTYQPPDYLRVAHMQPDVAMTIAGMEPGRVSRPVGVSAGIALLRVLEVRYPEDEAARAEARSQALERRRQASLGEYAQELRKRYAQVDELLLESLDYDAEGADLAAMRTDTRPVALIEGGESITVADLTVRMEKKMFHGLDRAAGQQRANEEAAPTLDRLIQERAVVQEAKRLGVEERPQFRRTLQERRDELLFGRFVSSVIDPKVKIEEEELRVYHAENAGEFSTPEMMRVESLAFRTREDAQSALEKLRQGADLKWMRSNAAGRIDPEEVAPDWRFQGKLLASSEMPEAAQDALAGAAAGDYRFCVQPSGGPFHVLWVTQSVPSRPKEYESVKKEILVRVFAKKRQAVLDSWMEQLRKASDVQVFVDGEQLRALLGLGEAEAA